MFPPQKKTKTKRKNNNNKNKLLNNYCINEIIKSEIKKHLRTNENENMVPNYLGHSKNNTKWEVNSDTGIPQEQEKQKSNNRTLHVKKLEKEHQKKKKARN